MSTTNHIEQDQLTSSRFRNKLDTSVVAGTLPGIEEEGPASEPGSAAQYLGGRKFLTDVLLTLGARAVGVASALAVSICTARTLGPSGRGEYFFVMTVALILVQVCNLGLHSSNTYFVAQTPTALSGLISNSLWLAIGIGGPAALLTALLLPRLTSLRLSEPRVLLLLAVLVPSYLFFLLGSNLLVGIGRINAYNALQIAGYLVLAGLCALGVALRADVDGFIGLTTCGWFLGALMLWLAVRGHVDSLKFSSNLFRHGAGYSARAYSASVLAILVIRAHVFILKHYSGDQAVGYFSIATQIVDGLNTLPVTVSLLLFPKLVQNPEEAWPNTLSAMRTLALTMLPICLVAGIFARPAIRLVFGPAYMPATVVLVWMLPGAFFIALISATSQYLSSLDFPLEQVCAWVLALGAVVVTGALLVPRLGLLGTGASFSLTYAALLILLMLIAGRYRRRSGVESKSGIGLAISVYPQSAGYKSELEARFAGLEYLALIELRGLGPLDMLRKLRAKRCAFAVLPVQTQGDRVLLPIALLAAGVIKTPRKLLIEGEELSAREIGWGHLIAAVAGWGMACLGGMLAALRCRLRLSWLLRSPRVEVKAASARDILYINANLWFGTMAGGSVGHVAGVTNDLAQRGFDVTYFATNRGMTAPPVKWHQLRPLRFLALPMDLNRYRVHHRTIRQIRLNAINGRPGFIYQRHSVSNFSGVELSRLWKVPLVLEYNGSEVWITQNWGVKPAFKKLAEEAEKVTLQHAHLIVTVSEELRMDLLRRGVEAERIVMYPNCVDTQYFDPARILPAQKASLRENYAGSSEALIVGFVGTFGPWHGAEVLAQAIRKLVEIRPDLPRERQVRFLLVGDGAGMSRVRSILDSPVLEKLVSFTGLVPQEQARIYLAACDIVVSPHVRNSDGSNFFGSPTKLFEYMAMAKPIIASNIEQLAEVLSPALSVDHLPADGPAAGERRLALLCAPGNPDEIIRALEFLLERPDWHATLGSNARQKAVTQYTWHAHVQVILEGMLRCGLIAECLVEAPNQHQGLIAPEGAVPAEDLMNLSATSDNL